jgi:Flp pilus assembly protein TadB
VSREIRSVVRAGADLARKLGLFVLLVAGSAAVGAAIAWPLWFFATSARSAYTAFALILAGCGIIFAAARAVIRKRRAPRDTAVPRRSGLFGFLGLLQALILLCGAYLACVLFFHGIWIFGVPLVLVCVGLLVVLGLARRALRASSTGEILPKIMKE